MDTTAVHQFSATKGNRKVWVINTFHQEYVEDFRGKTIVVPPNGEKKVLMPFLEARRFLGQPVKPSEQRPDGAHVGIPKALKVVELTKAEMKQLGIIPSNGDDEEERAKLTCTICGEQAVSEKGLKIHVTKMHSDATPAGD